MTRTRLGVALAIAGRQHQLLRQADLGRCGLDRHATSRLVRAGVLARVRVGILRVQGSPDTWQQRLLAAVWAAGPGAAASHRSAALLWLLDGFDRQLIEVSIPTATGPRLKRAKIHYRRPLGKTSVTSIDGIPVTDATLTLIDLGSVVGPDALEAAFDSALRQGLTTLERSRNVLDRLAMENRRKLAPFRQLLDRRVEISGITESEFEVRLVQVLRHGGLPEPTRQHSLYDADGFVGRFDCAYPEAMTLIEADSERHHLDLKRFHEDRRRRTRAEALGWRVPTFTYAQITRQPAYVVRAVTDILDRSEWRWRDTIPTRSASNQSA